MDSETDRGETALHLAVAAECLEVAALTLGEKSGSGSPKHMIAKRLCIWQ